MPPRHLVYATIIAAIHIAWTLLMFVGAVAVLIVPSYAPSHVGVLTVTLLISIPFRNACILTVIEERLRQKTDPAFSHNGSFITTHINRMLGARFNPWTVNRFLAVFYIASYLISFFIIMTH